MGNLYAARVARTGPKKPHSHPAGGCAPRRCLATPTARGLQYLLPSSRPLDRRGLPPRPPSPSPPDGYLPTRASDSPRSLALFFSTTRYRATTPRGADRPVRPKRVPRPIPAAGAPPRPARYTPVTKFRVVCRPRRREVRRLPSRTRGPTMTRAKAWLPLCLPAALAAGLLLTPTSRAADVGYAEDFALAKDRAAALGQLIPGTEDYYYYHCLHRLNTG